MNNRYGVDVPYFTKELAALSRSLDDRTPDELHRYLLRLADVALPPVKPQKTVERRKTVRAKRPVQQRKVSIRRECYSQRHCPRKLTDGQCGTLVNCNMCHTATFA